MTVTEWKGIFPYLVSPIDHNGRVKEQVLRDLVEHLIECGVHGLTPLGRIHAAGICWNGLPEQVFPL